MKRLILALAIIQTICTYGQISEEGLPVSYNGRMLKSSVTIPDYKLHVMNVNSLLNEDESTGITNRYSVFENVNINLKDGLNTAYTSENGQTWRYRIKAENAYSIQIMFSHFRIPAGAKLFLYNDDYSMIYGAFTKQNNQEDSLFAIADFGANSLILEYFEPYHPEFEGQVIIGSIGQAYKDMLGEDIEADGYIDINCREGIDWQLEKHAACKITFKIDLAGYLCSGALINNAKNDGTPYFLTANHCIDNASAAQTVVVYFNYERESCYGLTKNPKTLAGAKISTRGAESDFTLLKLNSTPPDNYLPYYAGWDSRNNVSKGGTCIHHPKGTIKRISKELDDITSYPYSMSWDEGAPSPANTHWQVGLDLGEIAGGSSGSPLFNKDKRIIGQLHGGVYSDNYFGKLSYSFTHSVIGLNKLKTFLDPDNTGISYLDGYAPVTTLPDAFFAPDFTNVCVGTAIKFTDYSAFTPTSWFWEFTPATVSFTGGTDANSENPEVVFNDAGDYKVALKVTNANGSDLLKIDTLIHAGNNLKLETIRPLNHESCLCDFDSLVIEPYGAASYSWLSTPETDSLFESYDLGFKRVMKLKPAVSPDSSLTFNLLMEGTHGSCTNTYNYEYTLVKQYNDGIANAKSLEYGKNGPFTNRCATIEQNEPIPPYDSCTGQKSWCDEYGNGQDIVENSVWYTLIGPENGVIGITSRGFDNQIALYSADSYEDILNKNYTIIAANDDFTDDDWNASIKIASVTPSKKYWLQVDGSGGGSEGEFYLYLYNDTATSIVSHYNHDDFKLYPQPADEFLTVESKDFSDVDQIQMRIFSLEGRELFSENRKAGYQTSFQVNTSALPKGIYFISIILNGQTVTRKFIK